MINNSYALKLQKYSIKVYDVFLFIFLLGACTSMAIATVSGMLCVLLYPFNFKNNIKTVPLFFWVAVLLFLVAALASAYYNGYTSHYFSFIKEIWRVLLVAVVAAGFMRLNLKLLIPLMLVLIFGEAIYGILQYHSPSFSTVPWREYIPKLEVQLDALYESTLVISHYLAQGTFAHHNYFGQFMMVSFIFTLSLVFYQPLRKYRGFFILNFALILVALVYSTSRGSWLALAIAVMLFLLIKFRKYMKWLLISAVGFFAVLSLLVFVFKDSYLIGRLLSIGSLGANSDRLFLWDAAFTALKGSPIFGISPGNLPLMEQIYQNLQYTYGFAPKVGAAAGVHNAFLQFWLDYGLLGLVSLIIFICGTIIYAFRNYIKLSSNSRLLESSKNQLLFNLLLGFSCAIVGLSIIALIENWIYTGTAKNLNFSAFGIVFAIIYHFKNSLVHSKNNK